jgi:hypothetical protein
VWLVRRFEQLIARGAVHQAPSRRRALQSLGRQSILSRSIADYPEMALYGGKPEGMIIGRESGLHGKDWLHGYAQRWCMNRIRVRFPITALFYFLEMAPACILRSRFAILSFLHAQERGTRSDLWPFGSRRRISLCPAQA